MAAVIQGHGVTARNCKKRKYTHSDRYVGPRQKREKQNTSKARTAVLLHTETQHEAQHEKAAMHCCTRVA